MMIVNKIRQKKRRNKWHSIKTRRDVAIFTNMRLIVRDAQGISGKKIEIYSLPYRSIDMWSSENAGSFLDFNSEIELWTKAGHIKVNLAKGMDIRRLDSLIASDLRQQQAFLELVQAVSKSLKEYINDTKDDIGPQDLAP